MVWHLASIPASAAPAATSASNILVEYAESGVLWPLIVGVITVVYIIFTSVSTMVRQVSREQTRREIAAYIAEGSMTPEQGERLMRAGKKETRC